VQRKGKSQNSKVKSQNASRAGNGVLNTLAAVIPAASPGFGNPGREGFLLFTFDFLLLLLLNGGME
jgi:hypothetical protein